MYRDPVIDGGSPFASPFGRSDDSPIAVQSNVNRDHQSRRRYFLVLLLFSFSSLRRFGPLRVCSYWNTSSRWGVEKLNYTHTHTHTQKKREKKNIKMPDKPDETIGSQRKKKEKNGRTPPSTSTSRCRTTHQRHKRGRDIPFFFFPRQKKTRVSTLRPPCPSFYYFMLPLVSFFFWAVTRPRPSFVPVRGTSHSGPVTLGPIGDATDATDATDVRDVRDARDVRMSPSSFVPVRGTSHSGAVTLDATDDARDARDVREARDARNLRNVGNAWLATESEKETVRKRDEAIKSHRDPKRTFSFFGFIFK